MLTGAWFPDLGEPQPFKLKLAKATAVGAFSLTVVTVFGWLLPALFMTIALLLGTVGFLLAFVSLAISIVGKWKLPSRRNQEARPRSLLLSTQRTPPRLVITLGVSVIVSTVSLVAGLASAGGYSQEPQGTNPRCKWSIDNDHGFHSVCVSYSHWLATGAGVVRAFLGLTTAFLAIACLMLINQAIRSAK